MTRQEAIDKANLAIQNPVAATNIVDALIALGILIITQPPEPTINFNGTVMTLTQVQALLSAQGFVVNKA